MFLFYILKTGRVEEITTDGMNMAGDNIDRKIAEQMHKKYCLNRGSY